MFHLLILCMLVGILTFSIHSYLFRRHRRKKNVFPESDLEIDVNELVGHLGQQCPVGLTTKWTLKSTTNGISCWKKKLDMDVLNTKFNVFGATIQISSSAKKILTAIEDVNLWKAWNTKIDCQQLSSQQLISEGLARDKYMQYDQVIRTDPLYHRFGNMESNSVSWILLWHMHSVTWTFFLAQPIDDYILGYSNQDHTLLTMIHCSNLSDIPSFISSSLVNINDLITISKLQLRPFCPSSPAISLLPSEPDNAADCSIKNNNKCHLLRQRSRSRSISQVFNSKSVSFKFTLVPFAYSKPVRLRNVAGFLLIPKYDTEVSVSPDEVNDQVVPIRLKEGRQRTFSASNDICKEEKREIKMRSQSMIDRPIQSDSSLTPDIPSSSKETSTAVFLKSMLFGKKLYQENSTTEKSDSSTIKTSSESIAIQETADISDKSSGSPEESKVDGSKPSEDDTQSESSSYELLLPNLLPEDMSKFKVVGARCVAEFLSEVIRASSIDLNSPVNVQLESTKGWKYDGITGKEIVSLVKNGVFYGMKTVSFLSKGVIPTSADKVWKAVQNPLTRFTYDETVKKIIVLRKLDHGQKLLHMYHESSTLLKKEAQDFCILQTERIENQRMIVALQSVEYDHCPLMHGVLRGMLLPSGWVIEGLPQDSTGVSCSVTYIVQMVVNIPDSLLIEEVMNTQSQCISNLRSYICPDIN